MHGVRVGRYRQVRDQLPEDGRPALWWVEFLGMNDLKGLMREFSLLSDWRANRHRGVPDREHGTMFLALRIPESDVMGPA